jgi:hypothetical protein
MIKNACTLLFVIFTFSSLVYSQGGEMKSAYLSVHSGVFISSLENFDKTYDSQAGLVYGLGLGLPLTGRSYIYGKATYFSKSGTPLIQTYDFVNGTSVLVSERREGTAKFTQWIINGGFLYDFFLSKDWTLGLNGGIVYTKILDERNSEGGTVGMSLNASGILGFFAGAVVEKNFINLPFSVFLETQYIYSRSDISSFLGDYGGMNISVGARYYFKPRRVE